MTRSAGSSKPSRRHFRNDHLFELANSKGRANAVAAWERIKSVPGPKTYEAYAALESGRRKVGGSE